MKIDELALQFFDNPKDFGRAMELLHQSARAWETYPEYLLYEEHFLSRLEEGTTDEFLFHKAEKYDRNIQRELGKLEQENSALKEILLKGNAVGSTTDMEALLVEVSKLINPPLSDDENPTLKSLFNEWCDEKQDSMRASSLNGTYIPVISLFIEFIDNLNGKDIRINELCATDIQKFRTFLMNLPLGVDTKNTSITDLVKLSANPKKKMSPTTIKGKLSNIGTFLKWVSDMGAPVHSNIHGVLTKFDKIKKRDKQQRLPFTDDHCQFACSIDPL